MDFFLLPEKIKAQLPPPSGTPPFVMNASGGLDGSSGECYLVVQPGQLSLFHKSIGVDSFSRLDADTSDPKFSVAVRKDKFNVMLEVASPAWSHKLKFSKFDAEKLESMAAKANAEHPSAAPSAPPASPTASAAPSDEQAPVELDPFIGLLAAAMFVAGQDGKIDPAEDALIKTIAGNDAASLTQALKVYKSCAAMDLAAALAGIDREGRLCIVANMFDVAIADGVLRSAEQRLINDFATAMGLSQEDYATIRDVLIVKGKSSFLKTFRS